MLVYQAAEGSFESTCQRSCPFRNVGVEECLQVPRLIPQKKRVDGEKKRPLTFVEIAERGCQAADIQPLLAHGVRGRVLACGSEIDALGRTADLAQPFGAAAGCAD